MDKKDQALLKKMIGSVNDTPIEKIASAFVDVEEDEVKVQNAEPIMRVDDSEGSLYCSLFQKGISGKIGSTGIEVSTGDDNMLRNLLESDMDEEDLKEVYDAVKQQYNAADNYGIFICRGSLKQMDIPDNLKKKYGLTESSRVNVDYDFVLMIISQCMQDRPGIMYDYQGNLYKDKLMQNDLKPPVCAFLYPTFSGMEPDAGHAMCFAKNAKTAGDMADIAEALFGEEASSTPEEQEEGFQAILDSAFPRRAPYKPVQKLFDYFDDLTADSDAGGFNAVLSADELADAVIKCGGISEEDELPVREAASQYGDVKFSVESLAPKNVTIDTDYAVIKTNLHDVSEIRKETVDGEEYLLIPARNVVVQSVKVR